VRALSHVFFFSTLVRCGEYRSQTGIQRKLNFVSVRTIKEGSSSPKHHCGSQQKLCLVPSLGLPTESEAVHPSINMETLVRHPAMRDWRGPNKLLLVIVRQKEEHRQRMIPVGKHGTSILFIPRNTDKKHPHAGLQQPPFSPMAT
jgi:hypothetical protein